MAAMDDEYVPPNLDDGFGVIDQTGVQSGIAIIGVLLVLMIIVGAVISIRKYRLLKSRGIDPFTVDARIAAQLIESPLLAPDSPVAPQTASLEDRLRELDSLRERNLISEEERRAARAALLGSTNAAP